jgi:hypothetical protein
MGIREVSKCRSKLASERIEVLHRRNGQPDEVLQIVELARRAIGQAVGERGGFDLQLHEPLQRPVAQLLGKSSQR